MADKLKINPEEMAVEEVAYGTQYALEVLLELLIEKGVINEQEFKDKMDSMIEESEEFDEINIEIPDKE